MDATAKPYLEKVQATTKPYTDAAAAKAKEVIEKIEVGRDEARRDGVFLLFDAERRVVSRTVLLVGGTELHVAVEGLWAIADEHCDVDVVCRTRLIRAI
jgi:hypothetical protein